MTIVDIALAYPALVLAIAIVAFRGQSLFNVCLAHRHRGHSRLRAHRACARP